MAYTDSEGRYHVQIMVAGKRVHRKLPEGASESDAKLIESQLRVAMSKLPVDKPVRVPGDLPLVEVMLLYMEHADTLRGPDAAKHHARRIGPWLAGRTASEAKAVSRKFIKDCRGKYAPATVNWSLSCLKKGLELAYADELTPVNYAGLVELMKVNNARTTALTMAQVKKISEHCSAQVRAALWIAIYTGCRRGEILKMRAEDIGRSTMLIHAGNTKTLKTRTIPIVAPLRPWLKHVPLKINAEGLKTGWERARDKAGMPELQFRDLRRSCATLMIAAGVDLYVVSKLLGHSSVVVTQNVYGHMQVDRIADGLDKTFGR